jgi:glycerate dehydrogenase
MISETSRKIAVLDGYCTNPGDLDWGPLRALGDVAIYDRTPPDQVRDRAAGAAVLLVNKIVLSRETLAALPDLRYVGVLATGYNIVDVAAARERGIVVTNVPAYGTHSVAQHAIALLLEITNRVAAHDAAARAGEWGAQPDWSYVKSPLVELAGKTLGVIGFGRIGRQTARIAHALGMRIQAADYSMGGPGEDFPFTWISLKGLLEESDVVSLHCPLTAENRGMINAQTLKRMKRTAILLNTSRGPLVEEAALAEALNAGEIAGAGLDVLEEEPPAHGSPLLRAKNCVVTPHIAWATREARERLLGAAVENLRAWIEGRPQNVVS